MATRHRPEWAIRLVKGDLMSSALMPAGHITGIVQLSVVGGFALLVDARSVTVPLAVQRLLAFLALHGRPVTRSFVAGSLWADVTEQRAVANLRATLWRTPPTGGELITCTRTQLALGLGVMVDLPDVEERARRLLERWPPRTPPRGIPTQAGPLDGGVTTAPSVSSRPEEEFITDLLPGWDDEWVVLARERLRQLRLHALEALTRSYLSAGDTARAVDIAVQTVAAEPLRESARRVLIEAHLAEGNVCEAVRECERYQKSLFETLGLRPSPMLNALIDDRYRSQDAVQVSRPDLSPAEVRSQDAVLLSQHRPGRAAPTATAC